MPGPSKWNRKAKARNDRRAAARSGGGRTASEAAFGRSQRAAGRTVSRTNTRVPKANRPRAIRTPLALPEVQTSIERLRQKYGSEAMDRGNREARRVNTEVSQSRDRAERKLENAALRSMPTRGEALKAAPAVRQSTRLNAEGTRVERLAGATQVGNEGLGAVMGAAKRGKIKRRDNQFTTPKVRRTERKVRRARRELRKARNATRTPRKNLMRAGLDAEQAKVLSTVLRIGRRQGASKKEMLAAVETALVESGIRNLGYGDADSSGWRQERAMYYPNPQNVKASAGRFFQETASQGRGAGMTAGQLAQAVQRSAFPDKYDERKGDAVPLLRAFNSAGNASPRARARLARAESRVETIDQEAKRLGIPGTKGLPADGKRAIQENYRIRKEKGEWAGSQALIQKILGAGPDLASDKEDRGGSGSFHDLSNLTAYAQDIPISGGLEAGEPVYDQALLDEVTKRIRKLGGEVPDLTMGMGYVTGYLQGYTLEIIPDSLTNAHGTGPHLHIGAQWTGEKPPPGTQLGGGGGGSSAPMATGSIGPSGTSFPSEFGGGGRRRATPRQLLRRLGYKVTSKGIERTGLAAGISGEGGEEETLSTAEMKRRYGIK